MAANPNPKNASSRRKPIIAIDGPAGSGKTTTAKLVAQRLGFYYIDTGAIYRALTLKVLRAKVPPTDQARVADLARNTRIDVQFRDGDMRVFVDGEDVTECLRGPEISRAISDVSANPTAREMGVSLQRKLGQQGGVVVEGRDIGTVVFPDAEFKFFLTADPQERARRRLRELQAAGVSTTLAEVEADIRRRDERDASRALAPLRKAEDAIVLDTTHLSVEEQVEAIVEMVRNSLFFSKETNPGAADTA
jgi:cytidylate kinase